MITHDEAETALAELRVQLHDWAPAKANLLRDYIAQQRAASVRVVEVLLENTEPFGRNYPAPLDVRVSLDAGQQLAIIERVMEGQ